MYLHIKGVTTWGAEVNLIIEAQHRWPVDERGRVDLTPPDDEIDRESWLLECEPSLIAEMSLCRYDSANWFETLAVREAPPDQLNALLGFPLLPGFELL